MYFADYYHHVVRQINMATGIIKLVVGTLNTNGVIANGAVTPATKTQLNTPYSLALDTLGNMYIANVGSYTVRTWESD